MLMPSFGVGLLLGFELDAGPVEKLLKGIVQSANRFAVHGG